MRNFSVKQIGVVRAREGEFQIQVFPAYLPALRGLEEFGDVNVVWWFDQCGDAASRGNLTERKPYAKGPDVLGVFATRSPARPNPVALSCVHVTGVDHERGVVHIAYIDAFDGSPVLDMKPYTPSLDRVEAPALPDWCAHWPACVERSGEFDWEAEFRF